MPTYEYECDACGHEFEKFQSMTDKVMRKCPECKKNKLQRLIGSGSGIIFKGSGFYETDYKKKSGTSGSGGEKKSESSSSSASESSTESKPKKESKKTEKK
ncbi:MAG: FmdB family zinc ribbon protein, partial [Planctomycetota bacterium]